MTAFAWRNPCQDRCTASSQILFCRALCVAWASLWTGLANPLCPWFIMIPDQINSFRWLSSRWEPFLSRRKCDNRCWWNLWITEAKNPMLPSGNLLLFAT
jgi:hypothetical protein